VPALCLGSSESNVFELVSAFSTFANEGVHTDPIFVTRIEDRQGNVIANFIPQSQDAVSERTAYTMLTMLQDVVNSGTAGRLKWQFGLNDMEIGGKTGTSEEPRRMVHVRSAQTGGRRVGRWRRPGSAFRGGRRGQRDGAADRGRLHETGL